jgi:pyruvate/2-oxoglutarate dehydrogenase complex dihydrolipoamide dehydrogenase (E3) component
VPSKALLAASGRVREMQDTEHLAGFGIEVGDVKYDREKVAEHAAQLVSNVAKNLGNSLTALGVDQIHASGVYAGPHKVKNANTGEIVTAKDIILAPGSVPFVPPGIQVAESKSVGDDIHLSPDIPPAPSAARGEAAATSQRRVRALRAAGWRTNGASGCAASSVALSCDDVVAAVC